MRFAHDTEVTANCDGGDQSGDLALVGSPDTLTPTETVIAPPGSAVTNWAPANRRD